MYKMHSSVQLDVVSYPPDAFLELTSYVSVLLVLD